MTSEGSGAIAFPVMTLALHIAPGIARDYSLMIQSCGMTSALCCVLFMKVKIENRAVILGTFGAIPGFIIGVHFVESVQIISGLNAVIGFFWRAVMMGDISAMAWTYFSLSVPVSSITGPLGSFLGSHLHRQVIAGFVYILELLALIGFLLTKPSWQLIAVGGCIIFGGFVFFSTITKAGNYILRQIEEKEEKEIRLDDNV
uniref:MFS domain-containing protein n=1 Tax=Heterorhabditis bacteriophora TaxID=37862 RepID=A0A1I7X2A1_HETBA